MPTALFDVAHRTSIKPLSFTVFHRGALHSVTQPKRNRVTSF